MNNYSLIHGRTEYELCFNNWMDAKLKFLTKKNSFQNCKTNFFKVQSTLWRKRSSKLDFEWGGYNCTFSLACQQAKFYLPQFGAKVDKGNPNPARFWNPPPQLNSYALTRRHLTHKTIIHHLLHQLTNPYTIKPVPPAQTSIRPVHKPHTEKDCCSCLPPCHFS